MDSGSQLAHAPSLRRGMSVLPLLVGFALLAAPTRTACAGTPNAYTCISPLPGSGLVSPWNNVAIRCRTPIDPSTARREDLSVVGSVSGAHAGNLAVSDDSQTLVFVPFQPYSYGETVTVSLNRGPRAAGGGELPRLEFQFRVAPEPSRSLPRLAQGVFESPQTAPLPVTRSAPGAAAWLPPRYPSISVRASANPDPGYLFLSPRDLDTPAPLLIIDNHAMPIFYRRAPYNLFDFKLQPGGLLTYFDPVRSVFYGLDSSYAVVDSFAAGNGYYADFHDLQVLPGGHALVLAYDGEPVGMDTVVAGGDPEAVVAGLIVQELDAAKQVVFQWRSWDHFAITDAVHVDLTASFVDYVHGNSVERDTDGNLIISSRHLCEVTKINRQTGAVMWRFGPNARHNDFQVIGDPRGFSYQHDARRTPQGTLTVFDNGNYLNPQYSRALEYQLDETLKTATLVREYRNTPDSWGGSNGNTQRRADGGTLVSWGSGPGDPAVTDFHADGSVALELTFQPPGVTTYRAFRHPWQTASLVTLPQQLDFGRIVVGEDASLPLVVTNRTSAGIAVTEFASLDSLSFRVTEATPITIPAHGSITVHVEFHPQSLGAITSTLYVRASNDTEIVARDVAVRGTGVTEPPRMELLYPNGGESYTSGGTLTLEWSATGGMGAVSVDLYLSRNGVTGHFETLALNQPNVGAWGWLVGGPPTADAYIRVVARDSLGRASADTSATAFTILPRITGVDAAPAPEFGLTRVVPNPARDGTQITYALARAAEVRLSVLDVHGRTIAVLVQGWRTPGTHQASWNGRARDARAPAGIYLVRYEAAGRSFVRRIALVP